MKYPTVSALCEGVAGAIREKDGSTEKINPQDFVQRIENLQVGGGTSESNIEYLDVSGLDSGSKNQLMMVSLIARTSQFEMMGQVQKSQVIPLSSMLFCMSFEPTAYDAYSNAVNAIGVDFTMQIKSQLTTGTVLDEVKKMPVYEQLDSIPRITKEQFYTLE